MKAALFFDAVKVGCALWGAHTAFRTLQPVPVTYLRVAVAENLGDIKATVEQQKEAKAEVKFGNAGLVPMTIVDWWWQTKGGAPHHPKSKNSMFPVTFSTQWSIGGQTVLARQNERTWTKGGEAVPLVTIFPVDGARVGHAWEVDLRDKLHENEVELCVRYKLNASFGCTTLKCHRLVPD